MTTLDTEIEVLENWPMGAVYDHKPEPKLPVRLKSLVDDLYRFRGGPDRVLRIDLSKDDSRLAAAYCKSVKRHWGEVHSGEEISLKRIPCKLNCAETRFVAWDDEEQLRVLSAALWCGAKPDRSLISLFP